MHQRRTAAMTKKIQLRINLLRYNRNTGDSGAALSHASVKIATPTQEKITLRKVSKTTKTPLTQLPNRMNGKMGRLALVNRPHTRTRRTVIIFRSPRMRRASAPRISSCLRNLLSRSASSAS